MKSLLKQILIGTPLESIARRVHRSLTGAADHQVRHDRDVTLALTKMSSTLAANATCVDIGSHRGEWLDYFATICPEGEHLAFEPLPSFADKLRIKYPKVQVYQCALSDHAGEADFIHAVDLESWSGLRPQDYPRDTRIRRITVPLQTLDSVMAGRQVDFIKIDVEGAELLVLLGAKETLTRCKPLVFFEFAKIHAVSYDVDPSGLVHFFRSCGMIVTTLNGTPLHEGDLQARFDHADHVNYARSAETNFFAQGRVLADNDL